MSVETIDEAAQVTVSSHSSLAELIARVRNLNLPSVVESAEAMFDLLKSDHALYAQTAEKLIQAHCLETMRMHYHHASLVIWNKDCAPKIALNRIEQVRTQAMAKNLRVATQQMRERLMHLRICGGNIQLRDASKANLQQHCHFLRRQIEGEMVRLRFFEAIAAQMKDGEMVYQRFTEGDLNVLRAQAMDVSVLSVRKDDA